MLSSYEHCCYEPSRLKLDTPLKKPDIFKCCDYFSNQD